MCDSASTLLRIFANKGIFPLITLRGDSFPVKLRVWRWKRAGSVSGNRNFGIAGIWRSLGHPFYRRLNHVLEEAGFDEFCGARAASSITQKLRTPVAGPRDVLSGDADGLLRGDRERTGHRVAGGRFVVFAEFLQIGLDERTPDHVTISRTRRLMDEATHQEVLGWVLRQVARAGLLKGETIGIDDATTLEAYAAMKSIVRRDTEESYTEYLEHLAEAARLETSDEAALRRLDRRRKKKGSNVEWVNPHDPEAQITRMKDGRTALAYNAAACGGHGHGSDCGGNDARWSRG